MLQVKTAILENDKQEESERESAINTHKQITSHV